jgi:hypothetical protein
MLPDVCMPLTTARVEEPADAVMVTEVALEDCQLRVTLWPLLIDKVLAEKVMVGATFLELLAQDDEPQMATITATKDIQRTAW